MAVKNTLEDLNNFMFEQMEILSDPDLTPEERRDAIRTAKTVASLGKNIVDLHNTALQARKMAIEYGPNLKGTGVKTANLLDLKDDK